MATAVPQKIILRSNTGISLNDRFSKIGTITSIPDVKVQIAAQRQMSARDRRFAQQMSNRPNATTIVVPGHQYQVKSDAGQDGQMGRTSAHLRLGAVRRGQGGRRPFRGGRRGMGRGAMVVDYGTEDQQFSSFSSGRPFVRSRRGYRGVGRGRGRGQGQGTPFQGVMPGRGRGGYRGRGFGRGQSAQLPGNSFRGGQRGRGQQRGGRGRGGRSWRRGNQNQLQSPMTREQLDNQLDEYMAKSRDVDISMTSAL